jgi:hypothetical protein
VVNEKQFGDLIQRFSGGIITPQQAARIAAKTNRQATDMGRKLSAKEFGDILTKNIEPEVLSLAQNPVIQKILADVAASQPKVIVEKEVRKESAYNEENIDTIANLADFDSEKQMLEAWREAKKVQANKERTKKILNAQSLLASTFGQNFESFEPFPTLEELKAKVMSDYERTQASKEWQFWLKAAEQYPSFVERRVQDAVRVQLEEDKELVRVELKEKYQKQLDVVAAALPYFKEVLAAFSK